MKELYPYGQCHVCNGEILRKTRGHGDTETRRQNFLSASPRLPFSASSSVIPGLEAFLCGGQCARWVRRERTGLTQIETSPSRQTVTRPKKTVTRKGLTPPLNGGACTPRQTASLSVNQPSLLEEGARK